MVAAGNWKSLDFVTAGQSTLPCFCPVSLLCVLGFFFSCSVADVTLGAVAVLQ